ncbi:MAG: hypothetical protein ACYCQI_05680, partial [Gammaproteobacteria bacterium]
IYLRHQKNPNDSTLFIKRNSIGHTTLADAIFYGFEGGVQTIKFMPNNEPQYGLRAYQMQKQNFDSVTQKIMANIHKAAQQIGMDLNDERYLDKNSEAAEEKASNLSQRFAVIETAINRVKDEKANAKLLFVPRYSPDDMRSQCIDGFKALCRLASVRLDIIDYKNIVMNHPKSLAEFAALFIASDNALLNGAVGHLFYDRAHLEACIEQDTIIQIGGRNYKFKDILREMIKQCDTLPDTSVAKEQFSVRLKLVEADLRERFPHTVGKKAESDKDEKLSREKPSKEKPSPAP